MRIVVIMPTYNEKENITRMIPLLEKDIFTQVKNHTIHLLVVDDKSPDGTADEVKTLMKHYKNIEVLLGDKEGLGAAYVRGMKYAMEKMHADAVIEFDADFQHDPYDIPRLIKAMDEGADYVIGSRYIPGGKIPKEWGMDRKFLSFVGGSLVGRLMLGIWHIHDITSGFKLTRTSYLKKVDLDHLYSKDFAYKMHILHDVVKLGAKVKEIPIEFYERSEGVSKINKKTQFDSLWVVTRLRWDDSKRFFKFLVVGGTGFIVQYAILHALNVAGVVQFVSTVVSAEAAIICNFLFNNFWTFQDTKHLHKQSSHLPRFIKFNLASLAAIIIQGVASFTAVIVFGPTITLFGFNIRTSEAILFPVIIFLVIPLNYLLYNRIIWKTHHLKKK